jgi:alpha-mannosidase
VAEQRAQLFNRPVVALPITVAASATPDLAPQQSILQVQGEGVVSALKPADRGAGVILRVQLMPGPVTVQLSPMLAGSKATRVDTSERDLSDLGVLGASITLDQKTYGALASIRLVPQ